MALKIYSYMKKRGFIESLAILNEYKAVGILVSDFFEKMAACGSYYNAFLRVKKILLTAGLIKFEIIDGSKKGISITERGASVLKKMEEIEKIITTVDSVIA